MPLKNAGYLEDDPVGDQHFLQGQDSLILNFRPKQMFRASGSAHCREGINPALQGACFFHQQKRTAPASTLPETNIAAENRPLEKEIPIGNYHF